MHLCVHETQTLNAFGHCFFSKAAGGSLGLASRVAPPPPLASASPSFLLRRARRGGSSSDARADVARGEGGASYNNRECLSGSAKACERRRQRGRRGATSGRPTC